MLYRARKYLGLGVAQSCEKGVDLLHPEREIRVRVQAEDLRRIDLREGLDEVLERAQLLGTAASKHAAQKGALTREIGEGVASSPLPW